MNIHQHSLKTSTPGYPTLPTQANPHSASDEPQLTTFLTLLCWKEPAEPQITAITNKGSPLSAKPVELVDGSPCGPFPLRLHLLFYSEECLQSRGQCLPEGTPSNILLSISKFTLPSPRLTCHLGSKSLPTPQCSSNHLSPLFKPPSCIKCLLGARLSSWMVSLQSSSSYSRQLSLALFLPLSLLIHALKYKPHERRDLIYFLTALSLETSIAPETHKALNKYLLS